MLYYYTSVFWIPQILPLEIDSRKRRSLQDDSFGARSFSLTTSGSGQPKDNNHKLQMRIANSGCRAALPMDEQPASAERPAALH